MILINKNESSTIDGLISVESLGQLPVQIILLIASNEKELYTA